MNNYEIPWFGIFLIMLGLFQSNRSWADEQPPAQQESMEKPEFRSEVAPQHITNLNAIWSNHKGGLALRDHNAEEAQGRFIETLGLEPFSSTVHGNLGLTFEATENMDKAQGSLSKALEYAQTAEEKFIANYNLGHLYGLKKDYELALSYYQAALSLLPTSKEIKTNIELMIQKQMQEQQSQKDSDQKDKSGEGDGKGSSDGKDKKDKKDDKDDKDKDKDKDQKDKDKDKDQKDKDSDKDDKDQGNKKKDGRQFKPNKKYKPRPYSGENLSEGDVKKILGELKQQEQRIRAEYYNKEVKEKPNGKDW